MFLPIRLLVEMVFCGVQTCRSGTNTFRNLLPGKWHARDDKIFVVNDDGSEEVLSTNWNEMRRALELEEKMKQQAIKVAIQQNQVEKKVTTSKKRGGRGC